ncbi:glycoside hydrolase family 43 protein [Sphingomonas sp.]|uniref:glycoside hydrolase family 43 protein n=1 Tax=Sphingomonas sp. TaxID=28214 RepID=UPI002DF00226|nr:glycoside hydrolase family 43 protein [Sphingomonas sp.]
MSTLLRAGCLLGAAVAGDLVMARQPDSGTRLQPTFATDFPDPFIIAADDGYVAFATNATELRANVQVARSPDLKSWSLMEAGGRLHDAMPQLPPWAEAGRTWAPEVMQIAGRYVLYFTARERGTGLQCVGAAASKQLTGPYVSQDLAPLVCQRDLGGTIDASPFRDRNGSLYLYYKNDGNNPLVLKPSQIWVQPLTPDGLSLTGAAKPLIGNTLKWEWRVVESPAMTLASNGSYVLFFSANHFGWENDQRLSNYAIGYATCAGPQGPCTKAPENPILKSYYGKSRGCLSGPGHQTVLETGGRQYLVFHAWSATARCLRAGQGRYMYVAPLTWNGATPVIGASLR